MSDLISRSKLKKEFDDLITGLENAITLETISKEEFINCLKILRECADEQPTTYDVEKVVAELEEKESEWWDTYSLSSGFDEYAHGKSVGFEEAIEIVRKGGV